MKKVLCLLICFVMLCCSGCIATQTVDEEQEYNYVTKYVTNAMTTPLRTEASNDGKVVCYIAEGEAVSFIENDANGYAHIVYEGNGGYVLASHLTDDKPAAKGEEKTVVVKEKAVEHVERATESADVITGNMGEKQIEEYVSKYVRPTYNNINNNIDTYGKIVEDGVTYWVSDEGVTAKVKVPVGTFGYNMERQYYYDVVSGDLIFAFVFKGKEEHRLYFMGDTLVRYIDPDGTVYNNPTGKKALELAKRCYSEGNLN